MFSNSSLVLTLTLIILHIFSTLAEQRENHFGSPCKLCECFIQYTDRDIGISSAPYRVAKDPYNSTEDRCLATCQHDEKCKVAVYGFVGGRDIFTCELYEHIDLEHPIYAPYTNIYLKRVTPCTQPAHRFSPLWTVEANQKINERKNRYIKLMLQQNPFNFG